VAKDETLKNKADAAYVKMLKHRLSIDKTFGFNRVLTLIEPDLKIKMSRQQQLLSLAVSRLDYAKIKTHSEGMIRGLDSCVRNLKVNGFVELKPDVWVTNHPKTKEQIIVCLDSDDLKFISSMAAAEKPSYFFSVSELLELVPDDVFEIKKKFFNSFGNVEIIDS
jgi:hypothetical protein